MIRKILAAVFITAGLAAMSVPLFYHFYGNQKTNELIEQFEQSVEQEHMEDDEKRKKEKMKRRRRIPKPPLVKRMQPCYRPGT